MVSQLSEGDRQLAEEGPRVGRGPKHCSVISPKTAPAAWRSENGLPAGRRIHPYSL